LSPYLFSIVLSFMLIPFSKHARSNLAYHKMLYDVGQDSKRPFS